MGLLCLQSRVATVAAEGCYKGKQLLYLSSLASSLKTWLPQTHPSPSHQKGPPLRSEISAEPLSTCQGNFEHHDTQSSSF